MFKRTVSFVLVCAMLFPPLSIASASTVIEGAKVSGDYEYKVHSDTRPRPLPTTTAILKPQLSFPPKWTEKTVKEIAEGAFSMLWMLASVTIPDSVLTFNSKAFGNCSRLRTIFHRRGSKKHARQSV